MEHPRRYKEIYTTKESLCYLPFHLFACVGDVRPGPNGLNSIILITDDKDAGSRQMLRQAKRYCKTGPKPDYS